MNITEFLEYMIDNSDGPVTFSVAGAKVSVSLTGDREAETVKYAKAISLAEARQIALRASRTFSMREVTERTVRGANNLGAEWIAGHSVPGYSSGPATEFLKKRKIPYTLFYGPNGRGTKMAFVNKKDISK